MARPPRPDLRVAAVIVAVEVDLEDALAAQQQIIDRLEQPTEMLHILGGFLEQYEHEMFRSGGAGQWAQDDLVTAELKGSNMVLVDSGFLADQLTHAKLDGTDAVHVTQGEAFYGRFLRDGDRGMPKRDPAPAPGRGDIERWADSLALYIATGQQS